MNDEYPFITGRRRFVQGGLVALGALPAYLSANGETVKATLGAIQRHEGMVLTRDTEPHARAFAGILAGAGLDSVALGDDPVRQWRDGLGQRVRATGGPLMGLTNWADYLLISGLALEKTGGNRRQLVLEMQHNIEQPGKADWAAQLAVALLHLPVTAERGVIESLVTEYMAANPVTVNQPSLFSWVIT